MRQLKTRNKPVLFTSHQRITKIVHSTQPLTPVEVEVEMVSEAIMMSQVHLKR
jgi:hypothetical protein